MKKDDETPEKDVWVLDDGRLGNLNQAVALAQSLDLSYEVQKIGYNKAVILPNFLLSFSPIHITSNTVSNIIAKNHWPKIIISSGRRLATVALYLKKLSKGKAKLVQIMNPGLNLNKFDLVVVPQHDIIKRPSTNTVRIIGALTPIYHKNYTAGVRELNSKYPELKNFIAVLIGGDSKNYKFTLGDALILAARLKKISANQSLPLLISFSRRTPVEIQEYFKKHFKEPNVIHHYGKNPSVNLFFGIIAEADFIISTADSISMCSEIASAGKPLYIFCPNSFQLPKHRFFLQQLLDLEIAKLLDDTVDFLEDYSYTPLNEADKIANIIKKEVLHS